MLKKVLISGLFSCLSINAFAYGDLVDAEMPMVYSSIITISGGPAWTSPSQLVYLYPSTPFPFQLVDQYNPNSPTSSIVSGEIFFGLQTLLTPNMTGELGLGIAGATDAIVSGFVTREFPFNTFVNVGTYRYKLDHGRIDLKGKLIASSCRFAQPYISGSVGAGLNQSHDFRATTTRPFIYPVPWYADNSVLAFSYTLGLGLQKKLTPNWQVGIGYEFADLGRSYLGYDFSTTLINGPYLSHFYTNELLFSLSYLFS